MLLFSKDNDSLCVLLNNIIPWKTQRPSTGLPIVEDIQAILCPSGVEVKKRMQLPPMKFQSSNRESTSHPNLRVRYPYESIGFK
jgi:hypothetical protein